MSITTTHATAEELAARAENGRRYELVHGELRMMSRAGGEHGLIAMRVGSMLEQHVRVRGLGAVFAAETGFLLSIDPDTVRAPDAAFVLADRFEKIDDTQSYLRIAPDLVIEVVSPNDSSSGVEEKANSWIQFGVRLVLVLDPANRTVRTYREQASIQVYFPGDIVDASDVVSEWHIAVQDVFS